MRCHRPAHWGFWHFSSCVEAVLLVTDLAGLTRQLSLWNKISIFSPSIFFCRIYLTLLRENSKKPVSGSWAKYPSLLLLQGIQGLRSLSFHHGDSACLFLGVPYFRFSLRFSHPSKSIFSITYIWRCFHLLVSSTNLRFLKPYEPLSSDLGSCDWAANRIVPCHSSF